MQVKGKRLDTDSGPRTRSRAAQQAERWDSVPLRLKLFVLTVDALAEAQAQVQASTSALFIWPSLVSCDRAPVCCSCDCSVATVDALAVGTGASPDICTSQSDVSGALS